MNIYIYDVYTEVGGGWGLETCHVFADSIVQNYCSFCGCGVGGLTKLVILCGRHKGMNPISK